MEEAQGRKVQEGPQEEEGGVLEEEGGRQEEEDEERDEENEEEEGLGGHRNAEARFSIEPTGSNPHRLFYSVVMMLQLFMNCYKRGKKRYNERHTTDC